VDGHDDQTRVLIAGGGVAAVEAILALDAAAGARVSMTVLVPHPVLELRPLLVATPFAQGTERRRFPLAPLIERVGATLVEDELREVLVAEKRVVTAQGRRIDYDALIVAVGARARAPFPSAMSLGEDPLVMSELLADLQEGYAQRVAFVSPAGPCWPLPTYELALMTRHRAASIGIEPAITVVTAEDAPLAVFGRAASERVARLLDRAGIEVRTGARASVGPSGRIGLEPSGELLDFQRVVALPILEGPRLAGLPQDEDGFVPIDRHARVTGMRDVYCAGDAADYPVKQGGLATQQADAAALHVAALAAAPVRAEPFRPVLRGRLMTGAAEQFFSKRAHWPDTAVSETPLWWPPTKVSGRHLTPWIAEQDPDALPAAPADGEAVERAMPLDPTAARRSILCLSPDAPPPPAKRVG
jgi:sulfide:quinone oxidoreductase